MIAEFDDFCLWTYVIVDELWRALPAAYKPQSGPEPDCSDSELLTIVISDREMDTGRGGAERVRN